MSTDARESAKVGEVKEMIRIFMASGTVWSLTRAVSLCRNCLSGCSVTVSGHLVTVLGCPVFFVSLVGWKDT